MSVHCSEKSAGFSGAAMGQRYVAKNEKGKLCPGHKRPKDRLNKDGSSGHPPELPSL